MTGWMSSSAQVATMECTLLAHATMQRRQDFAMHIKSVYTCTKGVHFATPLSFGAIPHTTNKEKSFSLTGLVPQDQSSFRMVEFCCLMVAHRSHFRCM
jgi:hypothetical protein